MVLDLGVRYTFQLNCDSKLEINRDQGLDLAARCRPKARACFFVCRDIIFIITLITVWGVCVSLEAGRAELSELFVSIAACV